MPISALNIATPIRRRVQVAPRDFARRDHAISRFDAGDFVDSINATLGYLLPTAAPNLASEALRLVQGSARVHVEIQGEELLIRAPLVTLTGEAQVVAAMRFFLTRLSATGQLFQPRLREQTVALEFRERLALLHPLKLLEVMQRLPMEADNHDAWLVQQFGVVMAEREPVAELSDAEFDAAWEIWSAHWTAVEELMTESRRRRQISVLDSLGSFAVNHLVYTLPLFGPVRSRINECADEFTNRDDTATKRDSELAKCVKEMRQITPQALRACLGHVSHAINPLHEGTPSLLTSILGGGGRMQKTGEHRAAGRGLEATLELVADYLYLLAHHSWPNEIDAALRAGLASASGKPWREAADLLWNHANATAKTFGSHGVQDKDDASDADEEMHGDFDAHPHPHHEH